MTSKPLEKIIYVEDEPDIMAITLIALQDLGGFNVVSCSSGKEALEKASEFNPDLFLVDVMMPEMDGPTTLQHLRKLPQFANTPFVFMTAKAQASEVKEYLAMGAAAVITKPFDPMTLAETLKGIWEKAAN